MSPTHSVRLPTIPRSMRRVGCSAKCTQGQTVAASGARVAATKQPSRHMLRCKISIVERTVVVSIRCVVVVVVQIHIELWYFCKLVERFRLELALQVCK